MMYNMRGQLITEIVKELHLTLVSWHWCISNHAHFVDSQLVVATSPDSAVCMLTIPQATRFCSTLTARNSRRYQSRCLSCVLFGGSRSSSPFNVVYYNILKSTQNYKALLIFSSTFTMAARGLLYPLRRCTMLIRALVMAEITLPSPNSPNNGR